MKAILCVFGNRSHQCFNRWHIDLTGSLRGLLKGVAHLWKNEGVAPLRGLLYNVLLCICVEPANPYDRSEDNNQKSYNECGDGEAANDPIQAGEICPKSLSLTVTLI